MGCFCDRLPKESQILSDTGNAKPNVQNQSDLKEKITNLPTIEEKLEPENSMVKHQTEGFYNQEPTSLRAAAPGPKEEIPKEEIQKEEQHNEEEDEQLQNIGIPEGNFETEEVPKNEENQNDRLADIEIEKPDKVEEETKKEATEKANTSKLSGKGSKGSKIDYAQEAFNLINKIRQNPKDFVADIEKAKELIQSKDGKLIYAGKVKVALKQGEAAFDEAIDFLNQAPSLKPFKLNEDITIPVPDSEEDIKNAKKIGELVDERKGTGVSIDTYFKDSVKDFYVSVLLLVIDDAGEGKKKKKRDAIFSKKYKKIGISSRKKGKVFGAYYTFAK